MDGCEEEEEGEAQVVVVGLRPVSLDDEGDDDDVCYTELKPSTTLLVPIELAAEHQELLHAAELPEVALPVSSNNFSLMLEADDEEPEGLEMHAGNHLTLEGNMGHAAEEESNAHEDGVSVEHTVLKPEDLMLNMEELLSETAVPDVVEPNQSIEGAQMEQEMTESEPNMEDKPDEPAEEVQSDVVAEPESSVIEDQPAQAEQTEKEKEVRPGSHSAEEAQTVEEPEEEPVREETYDVPDVCASSQFEDSGLAGVEDDGLVPNETKPDEAAVVEASEAVPVAEDPDASRVVKDVKPKEDLEATAGLKEVQRSPARRGRNTVFSITAKESEKDVSEEEHADPKVPFTPRRVTRSSKQLLESEVLITPRRSTKKPGGVTEEEVLSTKATSPRKTPQKATPRRGSRRTRGSSVHEDEAVQKMQETSAVEYQSARKTRKVATIEVPEPIPEEKSVEKQASANASPSRVTRQSSRRLSLTLDSFHMVSELQNKLVVTPPRSRRKTRGTTEEKTNHETYPVDGAQLQNVSRRLTRSRHWNDEAEPEKPENLDSTNLLESALMERLNDGQVKASDVVTEIVRAKRRTRSVAPSVDHDEQSAESESTRQEQKKKPAASVRRTRSSKAPGPEAEPSPVRDDPPGAQGMRGKRPPSLTLQNPELHLTAVSHHVCVLYL